MRCTIAFLLCAMVLATPCLYDLASAEPSTMEGAASMFELLAK